MQISTKFVSVNSELSFTLKLILIPVICLENKVHMIKKYHIISIFKIICIIWRHVIYNCHNEKKVNEDALKHLWQKAMAAKSHLFSQKKLHHRGFTGFQIRQWHDKTQIVFSDTQKHPTQNVISQWEFLSWMWKFLWWIFIFT